jgi:hypothetical protein
MIKAKDLLNYRINLRLILVVALFLSLILIYPVGTYVQKTIQCKAVLKQYESAIGIVSELDIKARDEWESFPIYKDGFGDDPRDPNGDGGRIFSNFDEYFGEKYGFTSDSELRISQLLIIQNPQCFSPREVAEAQDYVDKVK